MSDSPRSDTAYVILGLLDARPRTGYEIKSTVDNTTRFFWAASYGQIYPELRRLEAAGLVTSERDDAGGRKRKRHRITPAGRRELRRWLAEPAQTYELRDEGLLKLFFADSVGGEAASRAAGAEILERMAERHQETLDHLREIEPKALASGDPYVLGVLRYGIELNEWGVEYCSRESRKFKADRKETA
jgi:DNA-binding PadR family transcriptional regulator